MTIELKDFEAEYRSRGPYHYTAKGVRAWFLHDNYQLISRKLEGKATILDVGCGDGRLQFYVKSKQMIGLDSSRAGLKLAKRLTNYDLVLADMGFLPFRRNIFDSVVSSLSLQYLPKHKMGPTLSNVIWVLKEKGTFIATYPNAYSGAFKKVRRTEKSIRISSFKELIDSLQKNGFEIDQARGISIYIPCLDILSSNPYLDEVAKIIYSISKFVCLSPLVSYHYILTARKRPQS